MRLDGEKSQTMDESARKAAFDLSVKAYEHHKNHARFQETQRSWLVLAYFSFSGIVTSGIINSFISKDVFGKFASTIIILILVFHAIVGILVGLAISKVSREFRRHFRHADNILAYFSTNIVPSDKTLQGLMETSMLGTSGDQLSGVRQTLAKRLGVAAIHNYMISMIISADIAISIYIVMKLFVYVLFSFTFTFIMISTAFFCYNKMMETE